MHNLIIYVDLKKYAHGKSEEENPGAVGQAPVRVVFSPLYSVLLAAALVLSLVSLIIATWQLRIQG